MILKFGNSSAPDKLGSVVMEKFWTVLWDNEKKNAHKNIFYHREEDTDL